MKRALVLCGGGSLGSYEVGVFKYLKEKDVQFDIVTGTSIGAINGAMFAMGEFEVAQKLWETIAADKVMVNGMNFYAGFNSDPNMSKKLLAFAKTYISHGGADISPLTDLVKAVIDPHKIKTSPITLGVVTTSYPTFKENDVVLNQVPEENILDYLHASSACYPIFPIYKIGNKKFIDGGYNNNLPIDFAVKLGAEEVVAVLLHAIPKMPQHPELMSLPFVTTVVPSRDTGTIMDFDGKIEKANMILGYNDALKTFKEAEGYSFTFLKDPRFKILGSRLALRLIRKHPYELMRIFKALGGDKNAKINESELFIRALEIAGNWLNLDYLPIYSLNSFSHSLVSAIKSQKVKTLPKAGDFGMILSKGERIKYLMYLYAITLKNGKALKLSRLFGTNPETAALRELSIILKEENLL